MAGANWENPLQRPFGARLRGTREPGVATSEATIISRRTCQSIHRDNTRNVPGNDGPVQRSFYDDRGRYIESCVLATPSSSTQESLA